MPPKKNPETQAEQSARFKKDARKLAKAGELNLTDADAALDKLVRKARIGDEVVPDSGTIKT